MSDWTSFFKPKEFVDPDKDVHYSREFRVNNWRAVHQFNSVGQHRLKVYSRSKIVYSDWADPELFCFVNLDEHFGSQREWVVYGTPDLMLSMFPPVFKSQSGLVVDPVPLQPVGDNTAS